MYDELTQVDIDKMKAELEHRRLELRPKLIEDVQTARAFGDLSENYEYKVAKQEKKPQREPHPLLGAHDRDGEGHRSERKRGHRRPFLTT